MARNWLAEITSGTHAVIDLDSYRSNLVRVAEHAGTDRKVMAVIKANAYGHGAVECGAAAIAAGCAYLGVARIDEAIQLRSNGIFAPILVIGPANTSQIDVAIENNIALTVATERSLEAVLGGAQRSSERATVHLKVDTGLHRYGALPDLALRLASILASSPLAELEGVYSHFSSADERDITPTVDQISEFRRVVNKLAEAGITPRFVHVANSAATLAGLFDETNLVRAGIASYGLDPSDDVPVPDRFRQIVSVRSVLTRAFTLKAGQSVSYNRKYTAKVDERAGAVPIGYADGIERHLSNRGWFVHARGSCPILGRVCMDQTVVSIPAEAREGDSIIVIGDGSEGSMTVADVGRLSETNTYEPVTRIASRVPRLYVRSGEPYSWSVPLLGQSGTF